MKISVLISIFFLCGLTAFSQPWQGIYLPQSVTTYGDHLARLKVDSALLSPTGNGAPLTLKSSYQGMAMQYFDSTNKKFYIYNPKWSIRAWDTIHIGSSLSAGGLTGLTIGYLTKATSSTSIDSSGLYQNAGKFGIGTVTPLETFDIRGGLRISRDFYDSSNAAIKLVQIGTNTSSTLLKYIPSNINTDVYVPGISMIAQSPPAPFDEGFFAIKNGPPGVSISIPPVLKVDFPSKK